MKIIAHIPAREGSKRLPSKNLLPLAGKPLIAYAVEAALGSRQIDEVYVNTESSRIASIGESFGARTFLRSPELARDEVTQDTFNYDFICRMNPDVLVLVNPVCPLLTTEDIDRALSRFLATPGADSLVTTTTIQAHVLIGGTPANFSTNEILPRTQDIPPVTTLNWALGIWNAKSFRDHFEAKGYACIFGNILWEEIPKSRAVKINDEDDFRVAEALIKASEARG